MGSDICSSVGGGLRKLACVYDDALGECGEAAGRYRREAQLYWRYCLGCLCKIEEKKDLVNWFMSTAKVSHGHHKVQSD